MSRWPVAQGDGVELQATFVPGWCEHSQKRSGVTVMPLKTTGCVPASSLAKDWPVNCRNDDNVTSRYMVMKYTRLWFSQRSLRPLRFLFALRSGR